ncbi:DUF6088 family protein [Arachidicoccus sp.]|uniref:DUF6088 family protein n=1 Tax=Arachidicoccus sp. TaxID=1872624 RepID=UPI003D1952F5
MHDSVTRSDLPINNVIFRTTTNRHNKEILSVTNLRIHNIGNIEVNFKPTTPQKMALKGPLSNLVIQALEELGTENISEKVKAKLKDCLLNEKPALL